MLKEVKGNGMTLGFTDGINYSGFSESTAGGVLTQNTYGADVGSNAGTGFPLINGKMIGITTDETKSGIESVIDTNTNYIIKY